jgi:hypothetical protein
MRPFGSERETYGRRKSRAPVTPNWWNWLSAPAPHDRSRWENRPAVHVAAGGALLLGCPNQPVDVIAKQRANAKTPHFSAVPHQARVDQLRGQWALERRSAGDPPSNPSRGASAVIVAKAAAQFPVAVDADAADPAALAPRLDIERAGLRPACPCRRWWRRSNPAGRVSRWCRPKSLVTVGREPGCRFERSSAVAALPAIFAPVRAHPAQDCCRRRAARAVIVAAWRGRYWLPRRSERRPYPPCDPVR